MLAAPSYKCGLRNSRADSLRMPKWARPSTTHPLLEFEDAVQIFIAAVLKVEDQRPGALDW
jgi:hypothetical protein